MKKLLIITGLIATVAGITACGGAHGNNPGQSYMPDMYYARAYETYGYNNVEGEFDTLKARGITFNATPVPGTVARGEALPHHLTGDSAGLNAAKGLRNPLDTMKTNGIQMGMQMKEAERLYLINCGICHGSALDGNGPIYNNGNGAYSAAPANLKDPKIAGYSDGHYFHVITFGIRTMGSYASQLTPEQRWWVIKYIRSKQATGGGAPATGDSTNRAPNENLQGGATGPLVQPANSNQPR